MAASGEGGAEGGRTRGLRETEGESGDAQREGERSVHHVAVSLRTQTPGARASKRACSAQLLVRQSRLVTRAASWRGHCASAHAVSGDAASAGLSPLATARQRNETSRSPPVISA